jgi:hypothetical protein
VATLPTPPEGDSDLSFTIVNAGGVGTMVIDGGTWAGDPVIAGSGPVTMTPTPPGTCVPPFPVDFDLNASVVIATAEIPDN